MRTHILFDKKPTARLPSAAVFQILRKMKNPTLYYASIEPSKAGITNELLFVYRLMQRTTSLTFGATYSYVR